MKKILELRIWKSSPDPIDDTRKIAIYLFGRWRLVVWTYSKGEIY
jgi:hypothetical protein